MERPVKGDIVILEFPFSNLLQTKRRPALIIKVLKGDDLIASQITGKSYDWGVEIKISKKDFKEGGLKVESYLMIDKIFSIEKTLIKYKAGTLKKKNLMKFWTRFVIF